MLTTVAGTPAAWESARHHEVQNARVGCPPPRTRDYYECSVYLDWLHDELPLSVR